MTNINTIHIRNNNKASVLLLLFYILLFLKFKYTATFPPIGSVASYLSSILAITITLYFFCGKLRHYYKIQIFIFLMFVFGYSASVFTQNYRINDYLLNFQYFGIALIPLFYKLDYRLFKWALLILLGFFILNIIQNVNPNDVFSVSRNSISVFILIFYCNYVISSLQNEKNVSILMLVVCFLISIWAVGRGGIIAIGLLLLLMPYCKYGHLSLKLIIIYLLVILIGGYIIFTLADSALALAITRFDNMGLDANGRDEPNTEYLNRLFDSYFNFVYGVNLAGNKVFEALDLNPHNSLIRLHIYYGVSGFVLVFLYVVKSLYKYICNNNYVYALLLFVLIIRSLVDSTAFHGPFDGLIFYFLFYTLYKNVIIKNLEYV